LKKLHMVTSVLLISLSVALVSMFVIMRVQGSFVAVEENVWIWGFEVTFFSICAIIGILSLVVKQRKEQRTRQ